MRKGRSTSKPTKAEEAHILAVKYGGCVCCWLLGYHRDDDGPLAEAHHLLSGGIRRGHEHTIGLCPYHHRAQLIVSSWDHAMHRVRLGPSLAEGSTPFHDYFGSDDDLQAMQSRLLQQRHPTTGGTRP